jgi:signal transduction histidine kinase
MNLTPSPSFRWRYGIAVLSVLLATFVRVALQPFLEARLPFVAFIVAAMFTAWYGGRGPGLLAVALGAIVATYFVLHRAPGGAAWDVDKLLSLGGYLTVGLTGSLLCGSLHTALQQVRENAQAVLAKQSELKQSLAQRQSVEEALREEGETVETINRIGRSLAAELELEKLVQLVTDAATEITGAQFGAFFYNVLNEQGESYTLYSLSGVPRDAFSRFPMPRNTAIFDPTFRGEGVARLDDVTKDPRYGRNSPYQGMPDGHLPVRSYLAVPVISRSGEVLGGLFFGHSEPGVFRERAEQIVVGIAAQAAIAIDNARLYEQERAAQEALRQRNEALLEADRQKDAFLAMLGHELRTPLAAVRNSVLLIQRRSAGHAELEPLCGRVERQVGRMGRIVDDLQDVSRIARGRMSLRREPTDLTVLVRETVEDQRGVLEAARQSLILLLPDDRVVVDGDPNRLAQVLVNLLDNAGKFTDPGGQVIVDLSSEGDWARVTVRDTGIGIHPEMLPRVFESFMQAEDSLDRSRGGLGLGLALVKGLVQLHGGCVEVASRGLGLGAEFSFRLPLARVQASEEHGAGALIAQPGQEEAR